MASTRVISSQWKRFALYSASGTFTLAIDIAILWALTSQLDWPLTVSTVVAFLIAVSIHYVISKTFVFSASKRSVLAGYWRFITIALVAAILISLSMHLLVTLLGWSIVLARLLVGAVIGTGNFTVNLVWNFKMLGHRSE
ncbi:GtrA family protein [Vibrio sp. SCSIO 43136]|uniref:GtrA family protein n=1 Tax=Vibrio sp. SCSIO 43136 TaxID=2819101 RepID=UPI0020759E4E|nr:GtrA family protein [Vibrio sp. SCSIO 43136]USD67450.1 GtrA family protein [Vibrio sp. SCSIO 43136]